MKLRVYFYILVLFLFVVFAYIFHESLNAFSWKAIAIEALIIGVLIYLVFFYQKVVRPLQNISNGMDLLKEQDFSSRLRVVGQHEADRVVAIFNKMMEELKNERLHLREQNQFLDLLIKASPMGVVVMNFDNEITELNPSAMRVLGVEDVASILHKKVNLIEENLRIDLSSIPLHATRTMSLSDGTIYKCTHESFLDHGFPRSFYLIETLTEEVRRAEKKAYEKVIRMIAHEVNNTTAGITSTLDIVEKGLEGMPDSKDFRQAMHVCIERSYKMSRFITNFADVVKIPKVQLSYTNLNATIRPLIRFMEVMCADKNISITFQPDASFPEVRLDSTLFEQVLLNIIKNAVESIEKDGQIIIKTTTNNHSLEIIDSGKGIDREIEHKLFRPFFSTKPTGQGIGLLFIREVLSQHHCSFSLQTYPDGLTRFIIKFND